MSYYKCSKCGQILFRNSDKQWIKSYCSKTGLNTRIWRIKMKFVVNSIEEHEDGSATLNIDMDEETKIFLINHAVVDILKKAINMFESEFKKEKQNDRGNQRTTTTNRCTVA